MATVTGVTLAKMLEVKHNTIISARVENGILYFKKGDESTEFNVGKIVLPAIDAWPVGSIFMNVSATNPKILLGVPSNSPVTWVRWGQGRMPISLDPNNPRFDSIEEMGGLERVALTVAELARHGHGVLDPGHSHDVSAGTSVTTTNETGGTGVIARTNTQTTAVSGTGISVNEAGSGASHENMPPFITVYMWKRTV